MKPSHVSEYLSSGCGRCPLGRTPECKVHIWTEELILLRNILLNSELKEEIKWSIPCYTYGGKNILTLSAMKNGCVLGFFKGALIRDDYQLLTQQGLHSQASKVMKFVNVRQIKDAAPQILDFINQAIDIEKSGQKVASKSVSDYVFTEEMSQNMADDPEFQKAFYALTPGRQKGYLLYFSAPKSAASRISRIEKCKSKILEGKGFHDK